MTSPAPRCSVSGMNKIVILISLLFFGWYGAVPVPQCYVTQPDCPVRGSGECPYTSADNWPIATQKAGPCPMSKPSDTTHKSSPDLLDRFKIDQLGQTISLEPETDSAPVISFATITPVSRKTSFHLLLSHKPPNFFPAILLQKQSFLL